MTEKNQTTAKKRKRRVVAFPTLPFDQAKELAVSHFRNGSGQPVRRLTLFDAIGKSPESGPSRALISASAKYGLTKGGTQAEFIELTDEGRKVVDDTFTPVQRKRAAVECAITSVPAFKGLYEKFEGNKLPSKAVLTDAVQDFDVDEESSEQAVDIFLENLQSVELLQTLSGAERIVSVDHLIESTPPEASIAHVSHQPSGGVFAPPITSGQASFETTAFYITPIGSEDSIQRKHSDLFLSTLIEPAVEKFGLRVVRADKIDKPGVITRQVIQYLIESRLVVADLSYHNPNVFYELAIRHMVRKPVVQIIQKSDHIPFDVNQLRTIPIDNTDIYSWTPKLEIWRSEISNQIRQALDDPASSDSPVNWYLSQSDRKEAVS